MTDSPAAQFHLSIPVNDLDAAKAFYVDLLGCTLGREGERRIDINFFGHHVVAHRMPAEATQAVSEFHSDGADVSVRHFGAIVDAGTWDQLVARLEEHGTRFSMPPQVIRAGTGEEQKIVMKRLRLAFSLISSAGNSPNLRR